MADTSDIRHLFKTTPKGVKLDLSIYMYPDGHGNVTFAEGTNWPVADGYQMSAWITNSILVPGLSEAKKRHRNHPK